MADVQQNPVTVKDNEDAAKAADSRKSTETYHFDEEQKTTAPAPEDTDVPAFAASQTPPEVEIDETGTPQRKGSPSGVWKEGDHAEEDTKDPSNAPGH
jgi:hypothetical protein